MSALTDLFTNIANAIRGKTGDTVTISAIDFPTAISNIPSGAAVVTGTVIGYNSLSIPAAIGKTNCVVINMGTYALTTENITGGGHIDGIGDVVGITFKSGASFKSNKYTWTWDSETGTMSITHLTAYQEFVYIAW